MKTLPLTLLTLITAATAACSPAPPMGSDVAAVKNCPPDGCPPKDPGDPPPPPPPKAPQPDPKKYRTAYLSATYIQDSLNDYLVGTVLQLTTGAGDLLAIPSKVQSCTTNGTSADQQACIDDCNNDKTLTPAQRAQCRAGCTTQTCTEVCGAYWMKSFLRWGNDARAASILTAPRTCDSSTCPACATSQPGPSLDNIPIELAPFTGSYGIGPASIDVTCNINHWTFGVSGNIRVSITPDALYLSVPGATGSPSITCSNAPDPTVTGLGLGLKMTFPWEQYTVMTEASLLGDWHVYGTSISFLTDLTGVVQNAVTSGTSGMLNSMAAQKSLWGAFAGITAKYVDEKTGETFDRLGYIESQRDQLKVTYWVK